MVGQDTSKFGDIECADQVTNSLECGVVGNESGHVVWKRSARGIGCSQCACSGGEVELNQRGGDVLREGEEGVHDMDCAASEVVVLENVSM